MRSYAKGMMALVMVSSVSVLGSTAWADGTNPRGATHGADVSHSSPTYVPGATTGVNGSGVGVYSSRNSAVTPARAVGGGPQDAASIVRDSGRTRGSDVGGDADAMSTNVHAARGGRITSDNETRRPGSTNYVGYPVRVRHEKNGTQNVNAEREDRVGASAHTVPEAPGVSMVGDNFAARTGSRTTGMIPARAPESNERDTRSGWATRSDEPVWRTARGGGPMANGGYTLGTAAHDTPAPSGTIDVFRAPRVDKHAMGVLRDEDLRALPFRGDGTRRAGTGLLSPATPDRSRRVEENPRPLASSTWEMTRQGVVPGSVRGGGPRR